MPTIALTEKARSDLLTIHEHYASSASLKTAAKIILHILDKLEQLTVFSTMGRPGLRPGVRELVFARYPFLAQYRIKDDEIQVLRIRHHRNDRHDRD